MICSNFPENVADLRRVGLQSAEIVDGFCSSRWCIELQKAELMRKFSEH